MSLAALVVRSRRTAGLSASQQQLVDDFRSGNQLWLHVGFWGLRAAAVSSCHRCALGRGPHLLWFDRVLECVECSFQLGSGTFSFFLQIKVPQEYCGYVK